MSYANQAPPPTLQEIEESLCDRESWLFDHWLGRRPGSWLWRRGTYVAGWRAVSYVHRHEGRDHRSADFHRVARSTRREEEQNAGERTVDVIGQTRKTFRIPPRVLDGDRDVLGLARRDGGIIAQRQAPVRQQIVRVFHLRSVDVRIQEAKSGGVKF